LELVKNELRGVAVRGDEGAEDGTRGSARGPGAGCVSLPLCLEGERREWLGGLRSNGDDGGQSTDGIHGKEQGPGRRLALLGGDAREQRTNTSGKSDNEQVPLHCLRPLNAFELLWPSAGMARDAQSSCPEELVRRRSGIDSRSPTRTLLDPDAIPSSVWSTLSPTGAQATVFTYWLASACSFGRTYRNDPR
jgi:hypothetical protein